MNYLWCITKDWDNPADGEKWHKAKSEETAVDAGVRYIRENTHHYVGGYRRFVSKKDGSTVVDFGNHVWFILIKKEETKMTAHAASLRNCDVGSAYAQSRRFKAYCDAHGSGRYRDGSPKCDGCPLLKRIMKTGELCEMLWMQMPYGKEKTR